jgi:hypothetical protein
VALDFYFLVYPKDRTHQSVGEDNGDKVLKRPAYEALSAMTPDEIAALHAEADAIRPDASPAS